MKFTDTLYGRSRQKINQVFAIMQIEYWEFHQTLGHFRQQKVPVCGKGLY
ncbi:hypothetical protein H9N25_11895 [Pedobacter riviphilus]|uniref:Uncharacterized protein n=1 Tax=Pedobacter riviphilus TaxID=2766984 RepID=A0ABX6TQ51_9SPHI|nr:hypothetical protein [Pedobacter riviphilus]QNR87027.1 hypothetical protein H9N25_11895 [Pedobacter riviphilus]